MIKKKVAETRKKLQLSRETLHILTHPEMKHIVAGIVPGSNQSAREQQCCSNSDACLVAGD